LCSGLKQCLVVAEHKETSSIDLSSHLDAILYICRCVQADRAAKAAELDGLGPI
jgi:hypothetical protein